MTTTSGNGDEPALLLHDVTVERRGRPIWSHGTMTIDRGAILDFAFPHLKIGIEADGEMFHSNPKQLTHDKERDMKLAQVGWTILRFQDDEIDNKIERVMSTIVKNIMQKEALMEEQKKLIK